MLKKIMIILTLIIVTTGTCYANEENNSVKNVLKNKPMFNVDVAITGCLYDVRINDVSILTDDEGGPMDTSVPVNEWMQSGDNQLTVYLNPLPNTQKNDTSQLCKVAVSLSVHSYGSEDKDTIATLTYQSPANALSADLANTEKSSQAGELDSNNFFNPDKRGDVTVTPVLINKTNNEKNKHEIVLSRTVSIKLPFPKWAWLSGDKIENTEENKVSLIKQYEAIYLAIRDKNFAALRTMTKLRQKEMMEAYYTSQQDSDTVFNIEKDVNNPVEQLVEFLPTPKVYKYLTIKIDGHAKLAQMVAWDGGSVIGFNYNDGSGSQSYDFTFGKINGKWVIVR